MCNNNKTTLKHGLTNLIIVGFLTLSTVVLSGQNIIFTSSSDSSNHHYGMSHYDNSLYLTLYRSDQVTQISLDTDSLVNGYPTAQTNFGNHGIAIDETDGSIWTGTANSTIRHHSASLGLLTSKIFPYDSTDTEYQPINLISHGSELLVADRKKDSIYVVNKSTLNITQSFPISGMDSASAGGYIDLFIYSNKLYVVSDELDGITTMNLDGTAQEIIMISGIERLRAFGIYIKDDIIFLNGHTNIIITDLTGNMLDSWEITKPDGYYDNYLEMELINDQIYIASSWDVLHPPSCGSLEVPCTTTRSHLIVYDIPTNYAPTLATLLDATIPEDSFAKTIVLSALDIDNDTLIYSAVSDTNAVSITIIADTLSLTPALNWNGIANIHVSVSDGLVADTSCFTLTVTPVNDMPAVFGLLLPVDETIITDPENISQAFTWEQSVDVDGDNIRYQLNFSSSEWDLSISDINTTSYELNVEGFPRGVDILWSAIAFDNDTSIAALDTNRIQIHSVVNNSAGLSLPEVFVLEQNYPNPFNPTTTLKYGLPEMSDVFIAIYDIQGREIRSWRLPDQTAGWYSLQWDGVSHDGTAVGTGMYFTRLNAGDYSEVVKMVYLQ